MSAYVNVLKTEYLGAFILALFLFEAKIELLGNQTELYTVCPLPRIN